MGNQENKAKFIRSPCVDICALDEKGFCIGCSRTGAEIANWGAMSNREKADVLRRVAAREILSSIDTL